jgi:hypothetical protein
MSIKVITVQQLKQIEAEKLASLKLNTPFEELSKLFDISDDKINLKPGMKSAKMSVSHKGLTIRK